MCAQNKREIFLSYIVIEKSKQVAGIFDQTVLKVDGSGISQVMPNNLVNGCDLNVFKDSLSESIGESATFEFLNDVISFGINLAYQVQKNDIHHGTTPGNDKAKLSEKQLLMALETFKKNEIYVRILELVHVDFFDMTVTHLVSHAYRNYLAMKTVALY